MIIYQFYGSDTIHLMDKLIANGNNPERVPVLVD